MAFRLSPGVNFKETDLTNVVGAVSTSGGAFVGQFNWGPVLDWTVVDSESTLQQSFSTPDDQNYVDWLSCSSFLAYSNNLTIVRVVEATAKNSDVIGTGLLINNEDHYDQVVDANAASQFAAKYAGVIGNSLEISIADGGSFVNWAYKNEFDFAPGTSEAAAAVGAENDELHVAIIDKLGQFSGTAGTVLEKFPFVSKAKDATALNNAPNFYGSVVNSQSNYVYYMGPIASAGDLAEDSFVDTIAVDTAGDGYSSATATVSGDGTGATATVQLESVSDVDSASLNVAGTGYVAAETLNVDGGTAGTGAQITVDTVGGGGEILTFTLSAPGNVDYTASEAGVAAVGGSGTGATFDLTVLFGVATVTVTAGGFDYTTATVAISGDGAGAAGTVTLTALGGSDDWDINLVSNLAVPSNYKSLSGDYTKALNGGSNGGVVDTNELIEGWNTLKNAEAVTVDLLITGDAGGAAAHQIIVQHVIDNVAETRRDCVVFFSPLLTDVQNQNENDAAENCVATREAIARSSSYAFMDSGWKRMYDVYNDKNRWIPLNGDIAGLAARTDEVADPWFSPAGYNRGRIKNAISLAFSPSQTFRDILYKNNINPVVNFKGDGIILYGDKTLQAKASAFQFINVRRLFIVLERSIAAASKYSLFEFNDEFTRAQFINLVTPFLNEVKGRRGIERFKVVADESNNTPFIINSKQFIGDIFVDPADSINNIELNFIAVRNGVEFTEIG